MHKSRENKIIKSVTRIPRSCKENFTTGKKNAAASGQEGSFCCCCCCSCCCWVGGWAMGEKDQSLGMLAQSGSGGTDKKDSTPSLFGKWEVVEQTCPWRRDTGETPKKKSKFSIAKSN